MFDATIRHIKASKFPEFRFEWHPNKRTVYLIRVGRIPEIGDPIAQEVLDHGAAHNAVLIWLRGYRAAKAEHVESKQETAA